MELDWITPQQAAEQWGITDRRIQALCANGQVDGAVRLRKVWLIPKNSPKPIDGRTKAANRAKPLLTEASHKGINVGRDTGKRRRALQTIEKRR